MTVGPYTPSPPMAVSGPGPYPVPWPYADATAIRAVIERADGAIVALQEGQDYTLQSGGGLGLLGINLFLTNPGFWGAGARIAITRETEIEQDYTPQTSGREQSLAVQLDTQVMRIQELTAEFGRTLRLPATYTAIPQTPAPQAGSVLRWNADTNAFEWAFYNPELLAEQTADAIAAAQNAQASQDAAAASESAAAASAGAADNSAIDAAEYLGKALEAAVNAATYDPTIRFPSVFALVHTPREPVAEGTIWQGGGLFFQEAAPDATDHHVATVAGVKLYALPDAEGAWHFAQFGGLPSTPQDPRMCDDAMDRLVAAIPAGKPGAVKFAKGYHFFERGHVLPRDVKYVGTGAIPMHRFGTASATHYEANVRALNCTSFILCGAAPKLQSIRFATKGRQCGYDHAVTATGRIYNNAADATFELDDFTNQNATKANPPQPATPRLFSAGFSFVENFGRIHIENIRVIPSCPGAGEVQGVGGYLVADAVMPYADWDVGLLLTNPWGAIVKGCAVVGYYRIKGILSFGTFKEPVLSGFTPNAEHGFFEKVQVQCGFGFRDVDSWPIIDKTTAHIYVRWTASHQFLPDGGLVRIGTTDSVAGDIIYEYGSTSYTANATTPNGATDTLGDGWLILRDVRPLGAGANDTSAIATMVTNPGACSKVRQGFSGGPSHTFFDNCIFTDFAHATGLDEAAPAFAGLRDRYSTSLEISGVPARALKFMNCTFTTSGPRVIHVGAARDLTMIGDNYAEVRPYRTVLGGALDGNRGGVFLAGPSLALRSETGLVGAAQLRNYGNFLNDIIGMHPYAAARAGTRMQDQADYFWAALGVVDLSNTLPANTSDQLQIFGGNNQQVRIGRRSLTGALVDYLLFRTASGVDRIDMMKGQINILDGTGIRPSSNDTLTLGQTSFRWSDLFATRVRVGASGSQQITAGSGSPAGVVSAPVGSVYLRTDGGAGTTLYVKESGTGTSGWVAK